MSKPYTEQLAEWAQTRPAPNRRGNIAFLTVKKDVHEALSQGWPIKTIWAHLVELKRVDCGYDAFRHQVAKHLGPVEAAGVGVARGRLSSPRTITPASPPVQAPQAGFTFNAAPNKEELI